MITLIKNIIKDKFRLNTKSYPVKIDANNHTMQEGHTTDFSIPGYKATLNELFVLFQTDKASIYQNVVLDKKKNKYRRALMSGHNYAPFYEKYLKQKKDDIKNIIEIGSWEGSGLASLYFYFRNAVIYGLDITFRFNNIYADRVKRIICDQTKSNDIKNFILSHDLNNKIEVVIDDGLHKDEAILTSFNEIFLNMSSGGMYFVEDLSKEMAPKSYDFFMKLGKDRKDNINGFISESVMSAVDKVDIFKSEREMSNSVQMYLVMISKR